MTPTRYLKIVIPMEGRRIELTSIKGLVLAKAYTRVVIGGRGPYIEIAEADIVKHNIHIPQEQQWRLTSDVAYYIEYRSNDDCDVMIYHQRREVAYADYKPQLFYISPFDVTSKEYPQIAQWRV